MERRPHLVRLVDGQLDGVPKLDRRIAGILPCTQQVRVAVLDIELARIDLDIERMNLYRMGPQMEEHG